MCVIVVKIGQETDSPNFFYPHPDPNKMKINNENPATIYYMANYWGLSFIPFKLLDTAV